MRFGQVLFDRDELEGAVDELARAYMGGGPELFAQEDPRYMAFLSTRIDLKAQGVR